MFFPNSLSPFLSFLGEQVDVSDVYDALKDMKLEVTDKEYFHLVKTLPLDGKDLKYICILQGALECLTVGFSSKMIPDCYQVALFCLIIFENFILECNFLFNYLIFAKENLDHLVFIVVVSGYFT